MRICNFSKDGAIRLGAVDGNTVVDLAATMDPIVGGGYYKGMRHTKLGGFATAPAKADLLGKQTEELSGVKFAF